MTAENGGIPYRTEHFETEKIRVDISDSESCRSVRSHDGISECEETGDNFDDDDFLKQSYHECE